MVRRRASRGYSLIEVVVATAIFGMFIMVLVLLTAEMRAHEKRHPLNMMRHPQVAAVISRLQRDVLDAHGKNPYHRNEWQGFTQSPKTLILDSMDQDFSVLTIVWDFSTPTQARRIAYRVGKPTEWVARGLPEDFSEAQIDAVRIDEPYAVRLTAKDKEGRLAIDLIMQPRAEE